MAQSSPPASQPVGASDCSFSYAACARAHALDVVSTLFLFLSVSLLAGRVWRFPFDDEIYTFSVIERHSAFTLLTVFPRTQDVTPALSYLMFYALHQAGLSDSAMRLCSLAMTALALVLFQLLALTWVMQANRAAASLPTRLIAVLVFGLSPLAVSQGDALRWYPLFALLTAVFVTLYLASRNEALRFCSAAALGLAGSTSVLASVLVPAIMYYRYGLERRFRWSFDLGYWLLAATAAGLGIYLAYSLLVYRFASVHSQLVGVVQSLPLDTLGFFGGDALGVSQAWIVIPAAIITAVAAIAAIDRKLPCKPAHLLLLMLGATALMAFAGFGKPRSFLFLAPIAAVLVVLFFDRQMRQGHGGRVLVLFSLLIATSVSAIANIGFGSHPFKRNSVIPYQTILNFIRSNERGETLIVSTDPVIPWALREIGDDSCVAYFLSVEHCLNSGRRFDSIFVISGHSDKSANVAAMRRFNSLVSDATAGRSKAATLHAGLDEDAALKSHLSGTPLEKYILRIDYYR